MKYTNIVSSITILLLALLSIGCIEEDKPCTISRMIGKHTMVSDCRLTSVATIFRGPEENQIIFDDGTKEYLFEINPSSPCLANYKGENFGFGLLLPVGNMELHNDEIEITITTYLIFIPLKCNYTLELE